MERSRSKGKSKSRGGGENFSQINETTHSCAGCPSKEIWIDCGRLFLHNCGIWGWSKRAPFSPIWRMWRCITFHSWRIFNHSRSRNRLFHLLSCFLSEEREIFFAPTNEATTFHSIPTLLRTALSLSNFFTHPRPAARPPPRKIHPRSVLAWSKQASKQAVSKRAKETNRTRSWAAKSVFLLLLLRRHVLFRGWKKASILRRLIRRPRRRRFVVKETAASFLSLYSVLGRGREAFWLLDTLTHSLARPPRIYFGAIVWKWVCMCERQWDSEEEENLLLASGPSNRPTDIMHVCATDGLVAM